MKDGIVSSRPRDINSPQPYKKAALAYIKKGWLYPLPLPEREKQIRTAGYHGWTRPVPTDEVIQEWIQTKGKGNIALRLPENVIGIDVDHYGEKNGLDQLKALIERLGPLPATYRSSAREGLSGIRFFRVPNGMLQWHNVAKYIDIICWGIRYAVVYPSYHPTAGQYVWYDLDGKQIEGIDGIPNVAELPMLPDAWIDYLTNNKTQYEHTPYDETSTDTAVKKWADDNLPKAESGSWVQSDGVCTFMASRYEYWTDHQDETYNVHNTLNDAHWNILQTAVEGHVGWAYVYNSFNKYQLEKIAAGETDDRDVTSIKREWMRSFIGAVRKIKRAHEGDPENGEEPTKPISYGCPCVESRNDINLDIDGLVPSGSAKSGDISNIYDKNDRGNAALVDDVYGKHLHYLKGPEQWMTWDDVEWRIDDDSSVVTSAFHKASDIQKGFAKSIFDNALNLSDEAEIKKVRGEAAKWLTHANTTGETRRIKTSLESLSKRGRIPIDAEQVNSDAYLLGLPGGGVMELRKNDFSVRKRKLSDLVTMQTAVPYQEYSNNSASARKLWEGYLHHAVPDPEVREFLQILAGLSLIGDNHQNVCIFLYGTTKTGKSTLLNGILGCLGDYANPVNIDMFRQGEKNPSLFHAMQKRVITASEMSSNNVFHPDVFKNICGGEAVPCRLLYSNNTVTLVPCFVPWFGTNEAMTMNNPDVGVEERIIAVPFDVQNLDRDNDPSIKRAIESSPDVWSVILSWASRGYELYCERGLARSTRPQAVIDASRDFYLSTSELGQFIQAHIVRAPSGLQLHDDWRVPFSEVHDAHTQHCYETNKSPLTANMFARRMRAQGFKTADRRHRGKSVSVYLGIQLRDGDGPILTVMCNADKK